MGRGREIQVEMALPSNCTYVRRGAGCNPAPSFWKLLIVFGPLRLVCGNGGRFLPGYRQPAVRCVDHQVVALLKLA